MKKAFLLLVLVAAGAALAGDNPITPVPSLMTPPSSAPFNAAGAGFINGSGAANQIAFFTAATTLGGATTLTTDSTHSRVRTGDGTDVLPAWSFVSDTAMGADRETDVNFPAGHALTFHGGADNDIIIGKQVLVGGGVNGPDFVTVSTQELLLLGTELQSNQAPAVDGPQLEICDPSGSVCGFQVIANTLTGGMRTTLTAGTLSAGATHAQLVTATLAPTASTEWASGWTISSNAGASGSQEGLEVLLAAGFTSGNGNTRTIHAENDVSGAGILNPFTGAANNGACGGSCNANFGVDTASHGLTAGTNIGVGASAFGSATAVGVWGTAEDVNSTSTRANSIDVGVVGTSTATTNGGSTTERHVGVFGQALAGNIEVGGFFGLGNTTPTFTSAALMADNGAEAVDIFVTRDGGAIAFAVHDGGVVSLNQSQHQAAACAAGVLALQPTSSVVDIDANGAACVVTLSEAGAFLGELVVINIVTSAGAGTVTFPDVANVHKGPTLCTSTGLALDGVYTIEYADEANDKFLGQSCVQNS